ncbi:MAG: adenylate/guanylate cyclase domain-containing protein [Betaproteobacteria bacterium]
MLVTAAVLIFSFLLRVPTSDQAVLGLLERLSFDLQMKFLREVYPRPSTVEPILVGIDESAEDAFEEPIAMWHRHFAKLLDALAVAKPALVGMDVVLPSRSFDHILPGLDLAFLRSLANIKQNAPFVVVHTFDRTGKLLPIHSTFLKVLQDESFALDRVLEDKDRAARRFNELETVGEGSLPAFSGHIARLLGKKVQAGYIDFSIGGTFNFVPIQKVLALHADGRIDELKRQFAGKVVLIGYVVGTQDRWQLPVALSEWERNARGEMQLNQPGVIVHLQTLRSLLGDGLIVPIPDTLKWLICVVLLGFVFVPSNRHTYWFAFLVAPVVFFSISVILITAKILIPAVTFLILLWIAVMVGAVADGTRTLLEKNRFKQSFSGSVSPAVLQEMLAGNLSTGKSATTAEICVLFSDIRGFTGLSETLSPESVTNLLTRYFDRMVACVHRYDGTMDKFMGDGMMVLFGAPRKVGNPCVNAVKCGLDMEEALTQLNAEFAAEGLPHLKIGIGINYGKAVVGIIGSTQRNNYSAIGDAVNVASRVEGLTKRLGAPIVLTESLKEQLGDAFELIDFGEQAIRGHSAMRLWGVRAKGSKSEAGPVQSADVHEQQ